MSTTATPRGNRIAFGLALAAIAGAVDAVAYDELANLFVSFMSGNSTRLGVALAQLDGRGALPVAVSIALFVAGAFAGTRLAEVGAPWNVALILATEAVIAGVAATTIAAMGSVTALYAIAFIMGMQNAAHPTVAGTGIGKSFVTGTLFGVGQALAQAIDDRAALLAALANLLSWVAFVVGAVIGAAVLARIGTAATVGVAAACLAALAIGIAGAALLRARGKDAVAR